MKIDLYEHDCQSCTYLGRHDFTYKNGERKVYCLFFCENELEQTVIARWSDRGPDYLSGMMFADNENSPLFEAKKRAIEQGLIKSI